jgi:hypothetical protein
MALQVLNGPVIEAGQSLSSGLDCTAGTIVRLTMPAVWSGANLSFQISSDGQGYNDLFAIDGKEIVIPVVAGTAVVVAPLSDYLKAVAFLKVRSGTRSHPVIQPEKRDFAVAIEVP